MDSHQCSECGREFTIGYYRDYSYKTPAGVQCSYTCHDHALLRTERGRINNYDKLVKRCEESMRSQGKDILHPLSKKKGGKNEET